MPSATTVECPILVWMLSVNRHITKEVRDACA
jgi:hypothetical protein